MKTLLLLLIVALACKYSYGQGAASKTNAPTLRDILSVSTGKSITDPNSVLNTVSFLRSDLIVKEIGLDDGQKLEIKALLDETSGQPNSVTFGPFISKIPLSQRKSRSQEEKEASTASAKIIRLEREQRINEILDPIQRDRLKQIVYHIEIVRIGLGPALLEGFLGQDAGIEEFEKPALTISFETLQAEFMKSKSIIMEAAQKEILELLTEEQGKLLPLVMGKPFALREDTLERFQRLDRERQFGMVPDPQSLIESIVLLKNKSIANELGLSEDVVVSIDRIVKDRSASKDRIDASLIVERKVDSMLTLSQKQRLKQIAYRQEVARRGLAASISQGFLGRAIGIDESQRSVLLKKLQSIESKTDEALNQLEDAAKNKFVSQLSSINRQAVTNLLGQPFRFRE